MKSCHLCIHTFSLPVTVPPMVRPIRRSRRVPSPLLRSVMELPIGSTLLSNVYLSQGSESLALRQIVVSFRQPQVVLAAGAWSDELAAGVGLSLPIKTLALQMLLSTPAPTHILRPVLGTLGRALSLKQLQNGAFFLGGGWPGDPSPNRVTYTTRPVSIEGNWQDACAVLPALAQQDLVTGMVWSGSRKH